MFRAAVHMLLHVAVPATVARTWFRGNFFRAWSVMMLTMLVDLDHFLARPIYDPDRCSIGFHPLHQTPAMFVYAMLVIWPRTRLIGVGLVIHMVLDGLDCAWMFCLDER